MTQRHVPHSHPLPRCAAGHPARHIHDRRCPRAGGGHFIECQCRNTQRHPSFEDALVQWREDNRRPLPAQRHLPLTIPVSRMSPALTYGGLR